MTKKHFQMFADEIRHDVDVIKVNLEVKNSNGDTVNGNFLRQMLVQQIYAADLIIRVAQQVNESFDEHRFLVACGLDF